MYPHLFYKYSNISQYFNIETQFDIIYIQICLFFCPNHSFVTFSKQIKSINFRSNMIK